MSRPPLHRLLVVPATPVLAVVVPLLVAVPVHAHDGHDARPHDPEDGVWISEVVTDPQDDRSGEGGVTTLDEYVTVHNAGNASVDLTGWSLAMNDSTPETQALEGTLAPGATRTWHNPPGQMNNDVHLILRDDTDAVRDELQLGSDGVPDGNAADILDEAVHLVGPWAATRAPATNGAGLGPYWIEWVARATVVPAQPFGTPWVAAGEPSVDVHLHAAPNVTADTATLHVADATHALTPQGGGIWRSDPFPVTTDVDLEVRVDDHPLVAYPGRDALRLRVDATPPEVPDEAAVANGTRHLRWLPLPTDPESGIVAWNVTAYNETTEWPLSGCSPHDDPEPDCRLPTDGLMVRVEAENGAGGTATRHLTVHNDTTAPAPPAEDWFPVGVPPTWHWSPFDEPLKTLVVELADDVTGEWTRGSHTLNDAATHFEDAAWVPGDPRAYRLVATDRADHVLTTAWVALPPEAVPVEWAFEDDEAAAATVDALVRSGTATVTVTFDRTLEAAPELVLLVDGPRPARLAAAGALTPEADAAHYTFEAPEDFMATGRGAWSLADGLAENGSPMDDRTHRVEWDHDPPRLVTTGTSAQWIRAVRHVVTLHAVDDGDTAAEVDLDRTGKGLLVRRDGEGRRVTVTAEGRYELTGSVRDGHDNARAFTVHVAVDGTVPTVERAADVPDVWSGDAPLEVRIEDEVSGVNASTLRVWVEGANATHEGVVSGWDGDVARIVPSGGPVDGPFRVHVAVADRAGNLAEGSLAEGVAPTQTPAEAAPTVVGGNASGPAPAPSGPGWLVPGAPSAAPDTAGGSGEDTGGTAPSTGHVARAREGDEPGAVGGGTLDWVALGIVAAGGSVGLGTMVRRGRSTGRRSSCPPTDGR